MNVSTSWLQAWLKRPIDDDAMVAALERAGLEIEAYHASVALDPAIVAARIVSVAPHPGADRLRLVKADTGNGELEIVCGAPNVRAGMIAPLAQVGSTLPDGTIIKPAKLRGEVSNGMLCSPLELGLGDSHEGLLELGDDVEPGTMMSSLYPADGIIYVKTHANRFDLLSVVGLAREVAAMTKNELHELPEPLTGESGQAPEVVEKSMTPRYMLARLKLHPDSVTPDWMAARLRAAGMRPINAIVDVTNYAMLELGQPMHAYDAAKVKLPIAVRLAKTGEKLETLDGVERKLTSDDLVIADASGPIGLAGVMGGASTEVDAHTKEILLELAVLDASRVRKAAQRHGLRSEASARFERGLPVQLPPVAMSHAVGYFAELCGGELLGVTDQLNTWPWTQRIGLRSSVLTKLLGFEVTPAEAVKALGKLQIEARSFDIAAEARTHLGKAYRMGASFKTDGIEAFDCSYLTDYLYSLIGVPIGFTALGQYEIGRPVEVDELIPGDLVFYEGIIEKSATDHYYTREADGSYTKHIVNPEKRIGHNGIYIGDGKVITAALYGYTDGSWQPLEVPGVIEVPLATFTENYGYAGARRYVDDLADYISVPTVPWWRGDLRLAEDLVEEVVRVLGYDRVPATIPVWKPKNLTFDSQQSYLKRIKNLFSGVGLFEIMTYSFVGEDQLEIAGIDPKILLKLKNPLSSEQAYMRANLLPSHLSVLSKNRSYAKAMGYYEISRVFLPTGKGQQPDEPVRLGVTIVEPKQAYSKLKGLLDTLASELNIDVQIVEPAGESDRVWARGRIGEIRAGEAVLGTIGQIDPSILQTMKMAGEAAHMELDVAALKDASRPRTFKGLALYPSAYRDLSVVVDQDVTWQSVEQTLAKIEHISLEFMSDYYGREIPPGQKSLSFRIELSYPDRTPTEAEASEVEERVVATLKRVYKAERRG